MKVSVIIPTKDRPKDIVDCIASIRAQTLLPDELIIVDASSDQSLKGRLEENLLGVRFKVIYLRADPGLTHQRNIGVKASSGEIVFFLDDDIVLEEDFIEKIIKVFENDTEGQIGGCMGTMLGAESRKFNISMLVRTVFFLSMPGDGYFRLSGFPTHIHHSENPCFVQCLSGGLTAYRREVLNRFSFDENLVGYGAMEDDDFSYRVSQEYKLSYEPAARCLHRNSQVGRDNPRVSRKMLVCNHYYLFRKNFQQDFKHRFAFLLSLFGLLLQAVYRKSFQELLGTFEGILCISGKAAYELLKARR